MALGTQSKRKRLNIDDSDEWRTPIKMFRFLNDHFRFIGDMAASDRNHLCEEYFTKRNSALEENWADYFSEDISSSPFVVYVYFNPPYSKGQVEKWLRKAVVEMQRGLGVVALVPYTGQSFWHELVVQHATKIWMIEGRVPFGHPDTGVPQNKTSFTSAIIVYDPLGKCSIQTEFKSQDLWNKL